MNRRTTLFLIGITLGGLPALAQPGFAQDDPFLGLWQLNVSKSKILPGPGPKSQTMYLWEDEAKIRKNSQVTITAQGLPNAGHTFTMTHPVQCQARKAMIQVPMRELTLVQSGPDT
jgi:hypothetical protein